MNDPKLSELTVSELKKLIRETVQEAVAEVVIEINAIAKAEDELIAEAEMVEYLKSSLQGLPHGGFARRTHLDD